MTLAAVCAVLALAPPAKLSLRLGDEWTYRLEQSFRSPDSPAEEEEGFVFQVKVKVTGVKSNEYDWEVRSRLLASRLDGQTLPPPKGVTDRVEQRRYSPLGARLFEPARYDDRAEFRLDRLTWAGLPGSSTPSSWIARFPAVAPGWAPGADAAYRSMGKKRVLGRAAGLYSVRLTEKESGGMQATGTVELDEEMGIPLRMELSVANAPVPGGTEARPLVLKLEADEVKRKAR
jgi:hypothetical protein